MTIQTPPRREPRVLAVAACRFGLRFAVVDPWEIRSAGFTRCSQSGRADAVRRLACREKPTALASTTRIRSALREVSKRHRLGVVSIDLPTLPLAIASDLYPELPLVAPAKTTQQVAVRAIAAVLHAHIPPRQYATHR